MQQPIYNTSINGGVGGTGGEGGKVGGAGGDGAGPRVNVVNTPSQTIFQGSGPGIAHVSGDVYNFCQSQNVSPKQPLPLNTMDETFSQSQIYCNQLLPLRRGFPLYIPGPSEMLPAEYQTSGIQIGDVGTVTPEGLFRCFFNIYLPADHPINLDNVPDDFHPLQKYNERDLLIIHQAPGNYVSTSLVHKIIHDSQLNQFPGGD
ncbi:hypothetical protein B0H14DRAFT_1386212, partial [Mycena olivaceomarginata]